MDQWAGVAMLILTGNGILAMWLWLWAGLTARTRRMTVEKLFPVASAPVAGSIQQMIWPMIPVLGVLWIIVGLLVRREIQGREAIVEISVVIFLFASIGLIGIWACTISPLPRWVYPGWRAERFYLAHPHRIESELSAPAARAFRRSHHLKPAPEGM
ncbi:hypothetical protein [Schaalia vaccimaxillae]|uniref:hypothetical protein n=1 Tax=Schaalia vaccimaxillae TaxID=183916 RepID=UPI0003B4FD1D|nr:hypothetical protein [Schaalia vaccimaxillae]